MQRVQKWNPELTQKQYHTEGMGMGSVSSAIVHEKTYSLECEIPAGFPVQSKKFASQNYRGE
jgi:hypothetical protein